METDTHYVDNETATQLLLDTPYIVAVMGRSMYLSRYPLVTTSN